MKKKPFRKLFFGLLILLLVAAGYLFWPEPPPPEEQPQELDHQSMFRAPQFGLGGDRDQD